ncbi:MFS transporter [Nonomuraea sp. CA-141351]|uniref:MFS transporter n=1 Tax=Nonomuraea sp. CA-141351 TaxID=3239996 RepID=UPI003D93B2E9
MDRDQHQTTTEPVRTPGASPAAPLLLAVICATIFFDALDLSITQIALPQIQAALRVSTTALPWVATSYVVTYGGFLLLGGRAGDLVGARPVFLAGLAVFGAASLACGLAGDSMALITARAVQGVGAALTVPAAVMVLATVFPDGPPRHRAFSIFSAAAAGGFTAGLVLGGLITSGLSWRWIFLAKIPVVAAVLLAAIRAVPSRCGPRGRGGYDLAGALTATAGALLLVYGVTLAGDPGAAPAGVAITVAASVVLLTAFVLVERRSRAPLLPLRLLRQRALATADAAALTVLAAPFGVSFVVTLYSQDVLHRSPWQTALTLVPGSVASALVGRYAAPWALDRFGLRAVYSAALLTVAAGNALLITITAASATWVVIVSTLTSLGLGMGLAYPAATLGGIRHVPPADQGTAAGLNNTALQVGGGLGLAAVAAAVTIGLGGGTAGTVPPGTALHAVRLGAAMVTLIPLAGAAIAAFGLRAPAKR